MDGLFGIAQNYHGFELSVCAAYGPLPNDFRLCRRLNLSFQTNGRKPLNEGSASPDEGISLRIVGV